MNRYSHCEFYPDFHVNFIKKGSVNDVPPVTFKDMGFSEDTDYRDMHLWLMRNIWITLMCAVNVGDILRYTKHLQRKQ